MVLKPWETLKVGFVCVLEDMTRIGYILEAISLQVFGQLLKLRTNRIEAGNDSVHSFDWRADLVIHSHVTDASSIARRCEVSTDIICSELTFTHLFNRPNSC